MPYFTHSVLLSLVLSLNTAYEQYHCRDGQHNTRKKHIFLDQQSFPSWFTFQFSMPPPDSYYWQPKQAVDFRQCIQEFSPTGEITYGTSANSFPQPLRFKIWNGWLVKLRVLWVDWKVNCGFQLDIPLLLRCCKTMLGVTFILIVLNTFSSQLSGVSRILNRK